ncbi:MAG: hypothetical protein H0W88_09085 [Parachlamydiaceae bacterium]|nr:hypothetical protein [Parachlamydiaceae bacterium]
MQVVNVALSTTQSHFTNQSSKGIFTLSNNPLGVCLGFLKANSLGILSQTCHELRDRIQAEESFWKRVASRDLNMPNPFSKWTWRDCVIIEHQWKKNIYQEKMIGSLITENGFTPESEEQVHFWNKDNFQSFDLVNNKKLDFETPKFLEDFECEFFDGNRALFIKTNRKNLGPQKSEFYIIARTGHILSHFHLNAHTNYTFKLIENSLVLVQKFLEGYDHVNIHELPSNESVLDLENFKRFYGNIVFISKSQIVIIDNSKSFIYDLHQKKVIETIDHPVIEGTQRLSPIRIRDILIQTFQENVQEGPIVMAVMPRKIMIGFRKELFQDESGSRLIWKEIWRKVGISHRGILQTLRMCNSYRCVLFDSFSGYDHRIRNIVFDASTGEYDDNLETHIDDGNVVLIDGVHRKIKLINFNSYIYSSDNNQCIIRDFSPIQKLQQKLPEKLSQQNLPQNSKNRQMPPQNFYYFFGKIALYCLTIFASIGLMYLIKNRKNSG